MCSELSLQLEDWKQIIPIIEHVINNTPNKNNYNLTPNEIFLGFRYNQELIYKDLAFAFIDNKFHTLFNKKQVQKDCPCFTNVVL